MVRRAPVMPVKRWKIGEEEPADFNLSASEKKQLEQNTRQYARTTGGADWTMGKSSWKNGNFGFGNREEPELEPKDL